MANRIFLSSLVLVTLTLGLDAHAVTDAQIMDETYFTFFSDTGAGGVSEQGNPYAPTPAENTIGTVATFQAPGIVAFMNSPPYYIFSQSPVSWGFSGAQRADIVFSSEMTSISIGVRGTRTGTSTVSNI